MHCVYILYSKKIKRFYIGYTENLPRRIAEHERGSTWTTARLPGFELIFCEYFVSRLDAVRREKYFKTTKGKRSLKLILRDSLNDNDCPVV
ncbi:MAG: GIY-YIG nuclease family protein [Candidatus Omnitrophica bacterium]|nr:GIY-YIG nuclease family protein [Candidatus Omnitrophota bacterium]